MFRETTRRGFKIPSGAVVFHVLAASSTSEPLLGLTIGKAVGNSVVRHRTARRIRAAFATQLARLPAGSQWVVRALPGAGENPLLQADVTAGIERAMTRLQASS
jgi:ribonuclease P protein component